MKFMLVFVILFGPLIVFGWFMDFVFTPWMERRNKKRG